jgi:hypothetical protein
MILTRNRMQPTQGLLRQVPSDARDDRYDVDRTWRRSGTRRQVRCLREHDLRPWYDVTDRATVRLASSRGIRPKRTHVIDAAFTASLSWARCTSSGVAASCSARPRSSTIAAKSSKSSGSTNPIMTSGIVSATPSRAAALPGSSDATSQSMAARRASLVSYSLSGMRYGASMVRVRNALAWGAIMPTTAMNSRRLMASPAPRATSGIKGISHF